MEKLINKIDNFKIVDVLVSNIKLIQSFYNLSLERNENAELNDEIGLPFLLLMENNNCVGFSSLISDSNSNISYQIMLSENISAKIELLFRKFTEYNFSSVQSDLFYDAIHLKNSIKRTVDWLNLTSIATMATSFQSSEIKDSIWQTKKLST